MRGIFTVFALGLFALSVLGSAPAWSAEKPPFDKEQTEAIERTVRDYILKNPDIVVDALRLIRERQEKEKAERISSVIRDQHDEIFKAAEDPVAGNPNGDVTVVEFFDYQCPYCKSMAPRLAQLIENDDKVRFVYKEWPILGEASVIATRAALASKKQGKYQEFHDLLMLSKVGLNEEVIFAIAGHAELDVERLKKDMKDPEINSIIKKNMALAENLNLTGTPAFVIGNQLVPGAISIEELVARVREARKADPS